ncbi:hypothetical protein AAFF_G00047010 [Aldrovandia affinis]|uniref:Pyrin domain-containing protein n=1 Tax=Aldrovandia affinis TaxID=143900 RepID=A0AAD7R206_9TELE|nr:hypothetical protein AAFF_G00047010 [Aldrovandia affinis]
MEILWDLKEDDFKKFKCYLSGTVLEGCRPIPRGRLEDQSRTDVVTLMEDYYGDQRVNITKEILKKISRNDLIERLENSQWFKVEKVDEKQLKQKDRGIHSASQEEEEQHGIPPPFYEWRDSSPL